MPDGELGSALITSIPAKLTTQIIENNPAKASKDQQIEVPFHEYPDCLQPLRHQLGWREVIYFAIFEPFQFSLAEA